MGQSKIKVFFSCMFSNFQLRKLKIQVKLNLMLCGTK